MIFKWEIHEKYQSGQSQSDISELVLQVTKKSFGDGNYSWHVVEVDISGSAKLLSSTYYCCIFFWWRFGDLAINNKKLGRKQVTFSGRL